MPQAAENIEPELRAGLTSELPEVLAVGEGTALQLAGRCDPGVDPGSLAVALGPLRAAVDAERMPPAGPGPCDRWWAMVEIPAAAGPGEQQVVLHARRGGRPVCAILGSLQLQEREPPTGSSIPTDPGGDARTPLIAICMATWEPDPGRLAAQIESIRAQQWPRWVCVISDDASSTQAFAALGRVVGDDPRFSISRSPRRLGFYRNFERALAMAPPDAPLIALADQDDRWDPDKLAALQELLADREECAMAYSDMRMASEGGEILSETWWVERRNACDDLASLLVLNTITGAAGLYRRDLIEAALPLPPPVSHPYHDHWIGLCALTLGEIAYLDRPTYTRVRHDRSVTARDRSLARAASGREEDTLGARLAPRGFLGAQRAAFRRGWGQIYHGRFRQRQLFARVLLLRFGDRMSPSKLRALRRFAGAERSLVARLWLAARSLRPIWGRNETMAREALLVAGIVWARWAGRSRRCRDADAQTE